MFCTAVTATMGAYFFFVSRLEAAHTPSLICSRLDISIQDSISKGFISTSEIEKMVAGGALGLRLDSINTTSLEQKLTQSGVISTAEAFTVYPDVLKISVTQREPVLRLRGSGKDYYCDGTGYLLPVAGAKTLNLPVVTGRIPVKLQQGRPEESEAAEWLASIISLTEIIRNNAYWSEEVEQIDVAADGNMTLFLKDRPFRIVFGSADNLGDKFRKMAVFYRTILPTEEGSGFREINVKYKNQIICK